MDFVYLQERAEGHFRFAHTWFRVNLEEIALLHGTGEERARISSHFGQAGEASERASGKRNYTCIIS